MNEHLKSTISNETLQKCIIVVRILNQRTWHQKCPAKFHYFIYINVHMDSVSAMLNILCPSVHCAYTNFNSEKHNIAVTDSALPPQTGATQCYRVRSHQRIPEAINLTKSFDVLPATGYAHTHTHTHCHRTNSFNSRGAGASRR